MPFCIAVYILEKQCVHISKDTYAIPYHTYLFAALMCTSTMVHTWLTESKRVLLKRHTSAKKLIGVFIMIQQTWLKGHVPCPEKQPQTCCTWTLIFSEDQKPNHDNEQPLASNRARWPDRQRAKTENPLPFRKNYFHSGSHKTNFNAHFWRQYQIQSVCSFELVLLYITLTKR